MARIIKGFTLIELLVVVGIIGLLMAILLPALGRARQEAYKIQCAANLRQWGSAIQTFAGDHNNQFPHPVRGQEWGWMERPYITTLISDHPSHEWAQFVSAYLTEQVISESGGLYDAEEGHIVQWCPLNDHHRDNWGHHAIGYYYFPHRFNANVVTYLPETEGWTRARLDGPYSAAPSMSDEYLVWHNEDWGIAASHMHSRDPERALGSNFLFEDGRVDWNNPDLIDHGAINHAQTRDYWFYLDIPGLARSY